MEINQIRKQAMLSQSEFAKELGVPLSTIKNWDQGRSKPPVYVKNLIIENLIAKGYVITENKADTIEKIKAIVIPIAQKYGTKKIILFGSYARGDFNGKSDYDFCIDKGSIKSYFQLGGFSSDMEKALSAKVDIVTRDSADDYILADVEKEGVVLYES